MQQASADNNYTGWAHGPLGGRAEQVDAIAQRAECRYTISPPRTTGDGYYEAEIADPDGNLIEIVVIVSRTPVFRGIHSTYPIIDTASWPRRGPFSLFTATCQPQL